MNKLLNPNSPFDPDEFFSDKTTFDDPGTVDYFARRIRCSVCNKLVDYWEIKVDASHINPGLDQYKTYIEIHVYCHGKEDTMKFSNDAKFQLLENSENVEAGLAFQKDQKKLTGTLGITYEE